MTDRTIEKLIAASSLGTPEVVAARAEVDPALVERVLRRTVELDRAKQRAPLTYLSFVKEKCMGVLILDGALDTVEAVKQAWRLKLNPGGEVMVAVLPPELPQKDYERCFENRNRLLTPDEARELLNAKPEKEWGASGSR